MMKIVMSNAALHIHSPWLIQVQSCTKDEEIHRVLVWIFIAIELESMAWSRRSYDSLNRQPKVYRSAHYWK